MLQGKRLGGFLIGALLGCGLVMVLLQSRPQPAGPKALRPWQGRLLFLLDMPPAEDGSWKRIRVIEDPGWKRPVRLEETLMDIPHRQGSQVIARQTMAGDRVSVVPTGPEMKDRAAAWVVDHGGVFWEKPEVGPWLVGLPGEGDAVGQFLATTSQTDCLKALPELLTDPTAR